MARPTVLLDVDDVLCDFTGAALRLISTQLGRPVTYQECRQWDIFSQFLNPVQEGIVRYQVSSRGFCSNLKVLPGALEGLESLRVAAEVYLVTAPYPSYSWASERLNWIEQHLRFPSTHVVLTSAKHLVCGDVLIDDKASNLVEWHKAHPKGVPLLWGTHINHPSNLYLPGIRRVTSWGEVIDQIRAK